MSDFYVVLVYLGVLGIGCFAPFVLCLGYIWVDTSYPQDLSRFFFGQPVALIMGSAAIGFYLLFDRRSPPRLTVTWALMFVMALWVTLTTTWAVDPIAAWGKWDWAFKTVLFSALIPFMVRSRIQIEALIQVFLFSASIAIIPYGAKGLISGGVYGNALSPLRSNYGLGEGSTLAVASVMFIPFAFYLRRYSLLIEQQKWRTPLYICYVIACVSAAIATFARTAIIGFAALAAVMWLQSRHKLLLIASLAVIALATYHLTPERWRARIHTIGVAAADNSSIDESAKGRLVVWKWTLGFAKTHPFGGGFNSYTVNHIIEDGVDYGAGKAFHSIYFEVLGEHGFVGLGVFLAIMLGTIVNLLKIRWQSRANRELAWCSDLANALLTALFIVMAGGAFVGIAFQPLIWYLFALTNCLQQYVRRYHIPQSGQAQPIRLKFVDGISGNAVLARQVEQSAPGDVWGRQFEHGTSATRRYRHQTGDSTRFWARERITAASNRASSNGLDIRSDKPKI
jgi:putative inorganic carbon (HCO3(-)) transporter